MQLIRVCNGFGCVTNSDMWRYRLCIVRVLRIQVCNGFGCVSDSSLMLVLIRWLLTLRRCPGACTRHEMFSLADDFRVGTGIRCGTETAQNASERVGNPFLPSGASVTVALRLLYANGGNEGIRCALLSTQVRHVSRQTASKARSLCWKGL